MPIRCGSQLQLHGSSRQLKRHGGRFSFSTRSRAEMSDWTRWITAAGMECACPRRLAPRQPPFRASCVLSISLELELEHASPHTPKRHDAG
jgi:hypothetical protein